MSGEVLRGFGAHRQELGGGRKAGGLQGRWGKSTPSAEGQAELWWGLWPGGSFRSTNT